MKTILKIGIPLLLGVGLLIAQEESNPLQSEVVFGLPDDFDLLSEAVQTPTFEVSTDFTTLSRQAPTPDRVIEDLTVEPAPEPPDVPVEEAPVETKVSRSRGVGPAETPVEPPAEILDEDPAAEAPIHTLNWSISNSDQQHSIEISPEIHALLAGTQQVVFVIIAR